MAATPADDRAPAATAAACPVPPEQQPLQQFQELSCSLFFRWPLESLKGLLRALALCWLAALPLSLLVASGSVALRQSPPRLLAAGAVAALVLPLLVLVRQWLGWTTIHRRLLAESVDYEESGWYDGQVWEKPLAWRQQDWLVATQEVGPVLGRLQRAMGIAAALLLWGASLCQAL
ncbi:MAG: CGLD27 family protein [Prochlorococcaceae cyanobacterium]